MSLKLAIAILGSLAVLLSCTGAQRSMDRNVRLFDELAFGGPYDGDVRQDQDLVKWNGPVRVVLIGERAETFAPDVARQLQKMSDWTGLSIRRLDSPTTESNYLIEFSSSQGFSIRKDFVPCVVRLSVEGGVIEKAAIKISIADETLISKCIAHEIMHSFGFRYHSGVTRSILSPAHGEDDFTHWDELMLATLYNDSLSPGSSRADTLASVRGLIEKSRTE